MKPAHIFRDQVNVVNGWFSNWNDIEQTIACYFLLRRLGPTQARFLSLVLEHTFRDSANDVWVLEQEANNKGTYLVLYQCNQVVLLELRSWQIMIVFCDEICACIIKHLR